MLSYHSHHARSKSPASPGPLALLASVLRALTECWSGRRNRKPRLQACGTAFVSFFYLVILTVQLVGILPALADTATTKSSTESTPKDPVLTTSTVVTPTTIATTTTTAHATTSVVPAPTTTKATTLTTMPVTTLASPATALSGPSASDSGERGAPADGSPDAPDARPTPASASPGRAVGVGPTLRQSQILRLLETAAARRANLDGQIAEREAALVRAESERAAAQAGLETAQTDEQRAGHRLAAIQGELRALEEIIGSAPAPSLEPSRLRLPSLPFSAHSRLAPNRAVVQHPSALEVTGSTTQRSAVRRQARLARDAVRQGQDLAAMQQRSAAAQQTLAVKLGAVAAARQSLDEVREELWSALRDDPTMRQARAITTAPDGQVVDPTPFALADIPADFLDLYRRAAATCPGLSWTVVAAIGSIESSHGRSTAPGVRSGANSAGAMGPMQFLAETWSAYGVDGDGDGDRNVYGAVDSAFGTVNYLCESGAGRLAHLAEALWAYNHAGWYVDDVLALALRYGVNGLGAGEASTDVQALVQSGNLTLTEDARSDLLAGIVDTRVVRVLAAAASKHRIAVSVIKTGHSQYVAGTDRVSNHYYGRGVDIYAVDGAKVSVTNDAALDLALALLTSGTELRPDELGSPWPELARFPGAFSDEGHRGHLHVAWRSACAGACPPGDPPH